MRIAMNGIEAPVGQTYATMVNALDGTQFQELGQPLSTLGAVLPLEKGPDLDEFFLTFDLGQIVQLSEFQITFNISPDNYGQNVGQPIKPQMIILEGKKECMFLTCEQKMPSAATEADSEQRDSTAKLGEWQTADTGDWAQELPYLSDSKDQAENLYTFGYNFCVNQSPG